VILAFDTATSFGAFCAVTPDRRGRAERAGDLLAAVDELVADPREIEGIVVGRGPGSFTSIRIGLAMARSLALSLGVPVAGASTLDAYSSGMPVVDAKRGEVFSPGPRVCKPEELEVAGETLVGDGAIRYREVFEARGATIPPDDDPVHLPNPLLLVERAGPFGPAELVEPLYVRDPDAKPQP
jgi:tRNA threonylcarbamoyl adenosine modification protein YeaZ